MKHTLSLRPAQEVADPPRMELHLWSGLFAAFVALSAMAWLGAGLRYRFAGGRGGGLSHS